MDRACFSRMDRAGPPGAPAVRSLAQTVSSRAVTVAGSRALIARLMAQEMSQDPSFQLEVTASGTLSVEFQGQLRGNWCWTGDAYVWTPASGCSCHYTADDAGSAARLSVDLLSHLPDEDELYLYREAANDEGA